VYDHLGAAFVAAQTPQARLLRMGFDISRRPLYL